MAGRIAVVLFNLGGPDRLEAVYPFLTNLFSDPAILRMPPALRFVLGRVIAWRRAKAARAIYAKLGGRSPILPETEAQARALEAALVDLGPVKAFIAMRYWHPRAAETIAAIKDFAPQRIVLLPLYPQYSTTTTASSLAEWNAGAVKAKLAGKAIAIRSYPDDPGFVGAVAGLIAAALAKAGGHRSLRVLFSAHGLPQAIVDAGDPYPGEVEASVRAVVSRLGIADLDWAICYQSRLGPLKWLEPSIDSELKRAARDCRGVVIVPIAFVSEHSETLAELDIDYRSLAEALALPAYIRIAAPGTHPDFINGLAGLVRRALLEG